MLLLSFLQVVPVPLLLLLTTAPTYTETREIPWPFGSPSLKRFTRDGAFSRRSEASRTNVESQVLVGLRKMSDDQGEMFFPEYWSFEVASNPDAQGGIGKRIPVLRPVGHLDERENLGGSANASTPLPFQAPFALHTGREVDSRRHLGGLLMSPRDIFSLDKRQFQCPGNTVVCTSISRPNSCCPTGTTCNIITDTGYGDVGCCGDGQSCSGQVAPCSSGDTACSESSGSGSTGGGCCITGYTCSGAGCKSLRSPLSPLNIPC